MALSAKTGACQPRGQDTSNWYVGYVERRNSVYYFACKSGVGLWSGIRRANSDFTSHSH